MPPRSRWAKRLRSEGLKRHTHRCYEMNGDLLLGEKLLPKLPHKTNTPMLSNIPISVRVSCPAGPLTWLAHRHLPHLKIPNMNEGSFPSHNCWAAYKFPQLAAQKHRPFGNRHSPGIANKHLQSASHPVGTRRMIKPSEL